MGAQYDSKPSATVPLLLQLSVFPKRSRVPPKEDPYGIGATTLLDFDFNGKDVVGKVALVRPGPGTPARLVVHLSQKERDLGVYLLPVDTLVLGLIAQLKADGTLRE